MIAKGALVVRPKPLFLFLKAGIIKLMDYRTRKQTVVVLILAVFLGLILAGVYFKYIKADPTCTDGKKNQGETAVDCGGPCIACERLLIEPVKIEWVKAIHSGGNSYDLVARIENPNKNFGLSKMDYSFKLFDAENNLLKEQKGSSFILPGQKKYLMEISADAGKAVDHLELAVSNPDKTEWKKLNDNFETPNIFVRERQFKYLENNQGEASGILKNDSSFDFGEILVSVVLFSENKEILGINKTDVNSVLSGEERHFSTLWFEPVKGEVKSIEITAETNVFLDDVFMRRYSSQESEQFQQYDSATKK